MSNEYIEIYQEHKFYGQKDIIDSLIATLERIKLEEKKEGWLRPVLGSNKVLAFFQALIVKPGHPETIMIIDQIIDKLQKLKVSGDYQEQGETANMHLELLGILGAALKDLPTQSKIKDFFNYIMFHEGSHYFSMRESSIIEPSPLEILSGEVEHYEEEEQWTAPLIQELLEQKDLPLDIFTVDKDNPLSLKSDIDDHVGWAYENIYSYFYPNSYQDEDDLARLYHGIQHVSRAALYAKVFANLYRKHGDKEAENLSEEDLKLIQIAILFHDSAREDEEEDHWDHESAIFLYYYLTRILGVDAQKAKFIAEATANKDPSPEKGYFELIENKKGEITWQFTKNEEGQFPIKNIYQKIIHDCDCLDIIRARNQFDGTFLDFYKEIASKPGNRVALEEMSQFITEARSLIYIQGDARIKINPKVKRQYEHEEAYSSIQADVHPDNHPIIFALNEHLLSVAELTHMELIDLTPFDEQEDMTGNNLKAALREGRIFARGIAIPSAQPNPRENKPIDSDETLAAKELRKTMRFGLINVKSRKTEPRSKENNPMRSTSILGHGSGVYPPAGMLIFNPGVEDISRVSSEDFDSGRGSKKNLAYLQEKEYRQSSALKQEYQKLVEKMKVGLFGKTTDAGSNYPELLYDIKKYDAIFFTRDPTIANKIFHEDYDPVHPFSPLLQAIYLQKQYEIEYELTKDAFIREYGNEKGIELFLERFGSNPSLPIYEYSGQNNYLKVIDPAELTEEHIITMWVEMCTEFMKKRINDLEKESLYELSIDDIKVLSMYQYKDAGRLAKINQPGDLNYPEELRRKISENIENERQRLIASQEDELLRKLDLEEITVFSREYFINLQLSPRLKNLSSKKVVDAVTHFVHSLPYPSLADNLLFKEIYGFAHFKNLNEISPKLLVNNQMLQAYFLARQFGLDEEAAFIRNQGVELANTLVLDWHDNHIFELKDVHNLRQFMLLVGADERTLMNIDDFMSEVIQNLVEKVINEKENIHDFKVSIMNLAESGSLRPEHLKVFTTAYNHIRKRLINLNEQDFRDFLEIALLLNEQPDAEIQMWINNYPKKFYRDFTFIVNVLAKVMSFDDKNLDLFKELVEKIHTYDSPGNYVDFSYWADCIQELKCLVANDQFSKAQISIVHDKYQRVLAQYIENDLNSFSGSFYRGYHENTRKKLMLMSLSTELGNILKTDFLFVPESLLSIFNDTLLELSQENFSDSGLNKENIDILKKLHEKLPQQEKRQEAIDKMDEFLITIKHKEAIQESQPQMRFL